MAPGNGVAPLADPESSRRTLAGGRNARDNKPQGELSGTLAGVCVEMDFTGSKPDPYCSLRSGDAVVLCR